MDFALQTAHWKMANSGDLVDAAAKRSSMSLYAQDGALGNGVDGDFEPSLHPQ